MDFHQGYVFIKQNDIQIEETNRNTYFIPKTREYDKMSLRLAGGPDQIILHTRMRTTFIRSTSETHWCEKVPLLKVLKQPKFPD